MTDVSTIREGSSVGQFEDKEVEKKQQQEFPEPSTQAPSEPGESQKRMVAEESLQRATIPNLKALDKEQEISRESPDEKFQRIKQLLKTQLEEFKRGGGSVEELIKEFKDLVGQPKGQLIFQGPQADLKDAILNTYMVMNKGIIEGLVPLKSPTTLSKPIQNYWLELYELELETGFVLFGERLLANQVMMHVTICKKLLPSSSCKVCKEARLYRDFYWANIFPAAQKVLQHLEKCGNNDLLKRSVDMYCGTFFDPKTYGILSFTLGNKDESDLIKLLLPYVVKYNSLDSVKPCFDDRHRFLPETEKTHLWIDLLCQAAEIIAPTDSKQSAHYLELARKERDEKLWAYFFSPWKSGIAAQAKLATARIEKAATKCQGLLP